ncbi:MAG: hypothetical protein KKF77_07180 [Proteobacteria bacterium]|nr:hypothetical protein [Pseudomonadota bacterium]
MDRYAYSKGDRLDERNTYFYTPSTGAGMLRAWRASREAVSLRLPEPVCVPPAGAGSLPLFGVAIETAALLEALFSRVSAQEYAPATLRWLDKITHKFEVAKRFHHRYDERFRAVEPGEYRDLGLYIRAGEILLLAYAALGHLTYLNAAMKIIDTLCAVSAGLDAAEGARLSALISQELAAVEALREGFR